MEHYTILLDKKTQYQKICQFSPKFIHTFNSVQIKTPSCFFIINFIWGKKKQGEKINRKHNEKE